MFTAIFQLVDVCISVRIMGVSSESVIWRLEMTHARSRRLDRYETTSVVWSSMIDRGSGQTITLVFGVLRYAKYTPSMNKSKYWSARNQGHVYKWSDYSTLGLSFKWTITIKIQLNMNLMNYAQLIYRDGLIVMCNGNRL